MHDAHSHVAGRIARPSHAVRQVRTAGRQVLSASSASTWLCCGSSRRTSLFVSRQSQAASRRDRQATVRGRCAGLTRDLIDAALAENRAAVEGRSEGTHVVAHPGLKIWLSDFGGDGLRVSRRGGDGRVHSADAGIGGHQPGPAQAGPHLRAGQAIRRRPNGRPKIHEFAGALLGKQGDRSVHHHVIVFPRCPRKLKRINARIGGSSTALGWPRLLVLSRCPGGANRPELARLGEDF